MNRRKTHPQHESAYRVQVLDRTLGILDLLAKEGREIGPAEISEKLNLHKSTVHRLLTVLEHHKLVAKDSQNGKYALGLKLFELGSKAVARLDLGKRAEPYLRRLVESTGETAHVCVLHQGEMLSLFNVESPQTVRTPLTVGKKTPLHCTAVGKAVLAALPEAELDSLLETYVMNPYTRRTITSPRALKAELGRVRGRGYAVDDEEIEDGLKCVGAPVSDYTNRVVAAISIAGPAFRLPDEKVPAIARRVVEAATQLSLELGQPN